MSFYTASDLPRRFVMIGLGTLLVDVFEEVCFLYRCVVSNTPIEKRSFATLLEKMERVASLQNTAELNWITLSDVHPSVAGVGPLPIFPASKPSQKRFSPFSPTPVFDFPARVAKACWMSPHFRLFLAKTSSGDYR